MRAASSGQQRPGALTRLDDGREHARVDPGLLEQRAVPARPCGRPASPSCRRSCARRRARLPAGTSTGRASAARSCPSGGCSLRRVSPSRNTVVIGSGRTPVRAKRSSAGHRLQHPLARGPVRRAIVAGRLEQATVCIHEPVVHPPGADRDACGQLSPSQPAARPVSVASNRASTSQCAPHRNVREAVDLANLQTAALEPAGGHATAGRAEVDREVASHAHTAV